MKWVRDSLDVQQRSDLWAQDCLRGSNLPYRKERLGRTNRFRRVEVTRPPRITVAMGPSISRPGSPLSMASGKRPSPVTKAVINMGARRSEVPRRAVSKLQFIPSAETRCFVMRDQHDGISDGDSRQRNERTSEPSERLPPVSQPADTPPTSAKGKFASTKSRSRQ